MSKGERRPGLWKAAKRRGQGRTIIYGRGTGEREARKFLDLHVDPSKELIMIITEKEKLLPIVDAITDAGKLTEPGKGIIFNFPIGHVRGLGYMDEGEDM